MNVPNIIISNIKKKLTATEMLVRLFTKCYVQIVGVSTGDDLIDDMHRNLHIEFDRKITARLRGQVRQRMRDLLRGRVTNAKGHVFVELTLPELADVLKWLKLILGFKMSFGTFSAISHAQFPTKLVVV